LGGSAALDDVAALAVRGKRAKITGSDLQKNQMDKFFDFLAEGKDKVTSTEVWEALVPGEDFVTDVATATVRIPEVPSDDVQRTKGIELGTNRVQVDLVSFPAIISEER
ncbi:unnamed protein product, partial [Amoebophrya sp. A25]